MQATKPAVGEREVREDHFERSASGAAQRAPARYGVEFELKIVPKPALCPPSDPRHHLARCYRRPGSVVEADAEKSQQKRQRKQFKKKIRPLGFRVHTRNDKREKKKVCSKLKHF